MSSNSTSPSSGSPPSFFRTELQRALSEQSFGIVGYSLGAATPYDGTATIELLEHVNIVVNLTIRGYRVTGGSAPAASSGKTEFETLDALLQHYSPLYAAKHTELLFAKLLE